MFAGIEAAVTESRCDNRCSFPCPGSARTNPWFLKFFVLYFQCVDYFTSTIVATAEVILRKR
jgi:hypothetical protein